MAMETKDWGKARSGQRSRLAAGQEKTKAKAEAKAKAALDISFSVHVRRLVMSPIMSTLSPHRPHSRRLERDWEGFLFWVNNLQSHITGVTGNAAAVGQSRRASWLAL